MTLQSLILLVIKASIFLTVFAIGLKASAYDATNLFRRPAELLRAIMAMNILLPAFAVALVLLFEFDRPIEIALIALSLSPVPPFLPNKLMKAGSSEAYSIGLLSAMGMLAVLFVPLALEIMEVVFKVPLNIQFVAVAKLVGMTILLPLSLGVLFHHFAPTLAERLAKPTSLISLIGLLLSAGAILFGSLPAIWTLIGNGTLIALAAFVVVGLAVGHLLGGPVPGDRSALAFATASRHPGIAIALAHTNFPDQKLAMAAVLLYLLVNAVVSVPYHMWTRSHLSTVEKQVRT